MEQSRRSENLLSSDLQKEKAMELRQETELQQKISQNTIQAVSILQMGNQELEDYLENMALENPVIETEDKTMILDISQSGERIIPRNSYEDYQNRAYEEESPGREYFSEEGEGFPFVDYLLEQVLYMKVEQSRVPVLKYLIYNLDERGYLTEEPEEIAGILGEEPGKVREAIEILHSMEPLGVGAKNLQECLLLQLRGKPDTQLEEEIIRRYLKELGKNQISRIADKTGKTLEEVMEARERIRNLNPRPSNYFPTGRFKEYLIPDIIVVKLKDYFEVLINDAQNARFHISDFYRKMGNTVEDKEAAEYIREKIKQAEWLQQCLEQRKTTLLNLAEKIVERQQGFFRNGKGFLEPLTQREIAEEMGVHPSTVSRGIKGKYLQCPWGTYPLSFFFSVGIPSDGQKENSADHIKSCIEKIIEQEEKKKPFSDRLIAEKLQKMGISISRRTVAKYRDSMNIKDALGRKEY